jgi:hypothetical protein
MKPISTLGAFAIIPDDTGLVLFCHRRGKDTLDIVSYFDTIEQ